MYHAVLPTDLTTIVCDHADICNCTNKHFAGWEIKKCEIDCRLNVLCYRHISDLCHRHLLYPGARHVDSLELTFRTIFWALFGLKDAKTVELGEGFQSRFTESVGYIVFGVYNWGAVIVLLNMLIAMMTRSFDKIAVN
jgi:hypothetical protein